MVRRLSVWPGLLSDSTSLPWRDIFDSAAQRISTFREAASSSSERLRRILCSQTKIRHGESGGMRLCSWGKRQGQLSGLPILFGLLVVPHKTLKLAHRPQMVFVSSLISGSMLRRKIRRTTQAANNDSKRPAITSDV